MPQRSSDAGDPVNRALVAVAPRARPVEIVQVARAVERRRDIDVVLLAKREHFVSESCQVGGDNESEIPPIAAVV
jgi:hypothetical protein